MNHIKQLLNMGILPPEVMRAARALSVLKRWDSVVGAEMGMRCWPERYDRGVVWVAVSGSAWAQELRMQKDVIIERLNETAGEANLFTNLRFGVRPIKKAVVQIRAEDPTFDTTNLSIRDIAERRMRKWHGSEGTES